MIEERLLNRLHILIRKAYYGYKRYHYDSTFAYMYFEGELSVVDLGKYLRMSDHFIKLDENHYFIDFSHTKHKDAFKASQNLLVYLDKHLNNNSTCIAIDTFDTSKSATVVLNRLKQILVETKKKSDSRIEDEEVLNEIF